MGGGEFADIIIDCLIPGGLFGGKDPPKPVVTDEPTEFPSYLPTEDPTQDCFGQCDSADYEPLCCDGVTFDNRCVAECDLTLTDLFKCYYGVCRGDIDTEEPTEYPTYIPTEDPVCKSRWKL